MTAPPSDLPKLRGHLRQMLEGIETELNQAYLHKQLYVETRDEFLDKYPEADHTFLRNYSHLYADRQMMAIRRMGDRSSDKPVSLWWVVERLRRNPEIGKRQDLLTEADEQYSGDPYHTREWNDHYDSYFGKGETPSSDALEKLQTALASPEIAKVQEFADRNVAHKDQRGHQLSLTYADIHGSLTQLATIFNQVNRLFSWSTTCFCLMIIPPTWRTVFGVTLFDHGGSRRNIGPGCGACGIVSVS